MSNGKDLFTLEEFNDMHYSANMSIIEIAEKYNTYPNKIRRFAKKIGANFRNKSDAQKTALKTGRQKHPTKGKTRDEDVKIKISESISVYWDDMDDDERERRSEIAKQQWDNMSDDEKRDLREKAHQGIRKAAKFGSKLELQILEAIISWGYKTRYHQQHLIAREKMHLDILIPELKTAIEIDGPSHSQPIWGQDHLEKSLQADQKKDGLLLAMGFCVIRIKQEKDVTKKIVRDILIRLEDILKQIQENFPPTGKRRFIL